MKLRGCLCAAMQSNRYMSIKIFKSFLAIVLCSCILCATGCGKAKHHLVSDAKLFDSNYKLGDNMGDYTVTDVNGKSYTFSELLKTKKAIVLNFWFINCGPCQMEFPYLQAASDSYSDDVAVIAINPTDDNEQKIQKYATQNELSLPLVKGEPDWINAFSLQGFPTTVVIDRYGVVSFIHMGAVYEAGVFEKLFEFFSSDKYKQTTITNFSDIK